MYYLLASFLFGSKNPRHPSKMLRALIASFETQQHTIITLDDDNNNNENRHVIDALSKLISFSLLINLLEQYYE